MLEPVTTTDTLIELVRVRVGAFLDRAIPRTERVSPETAPLLQQARELLAGGKRLRPQFCYWGWCAIDENATDRESRDQLQTVLDLSVAIELFQASALVHDDLIDDSDLRRGRPAAHVALSNWHQGAGWDGDAGAYGRSAALLLGDLLLTWSGQALTDSLASARPPERAAAARTIFERMQREVMVGQYLDLAAENDWRRRPPSDARGRVERVMTYKTARYTAVHPLLLGATIAGANQVQLRHLAEYGRNAGLAFQLRDDILGVFGDPDQTGKPAGDDLREGKRTLLVALTRERVSGSVSKVFDDMLGSPRLTADQISTLRTTIRDCGALQQCEELIAQWTAQAVAALHGGRLAEPAVDALRSLARRAGTRNR